MQTSIQLWFAVRYTHIVSVSLLTGGAFMLCALCASVRAPRGVAVAVVPAVLYEWAFWFLIGVGVATGVGNLGMRGQGLSALETDWGRALTVKLTAVLLLLALSVVRSDFVIRWRAVPESTVMGSRLRVVLAGLYGLTGAILIGALWLGLGLAHGRY